MHLLFDAAKSDSKVAQSVRNLNQQGLCDLATFELMLIYPEQSIEISQLILNLQEHSYSDSTSLVEKFRKSSISEEHMKTMIDLLNLMLENNTYYANVINILLKQEQYIDKIYEGAKKLVAEHYPLGDYFGLLEKNSKNANIFAKNILLLDKASLINYGNSDDLLMVSKLDVGAFHFMKHLQLAGMLDNRSFQKVCEANNILTRKEVIETLSNLPLMTQFERKELEQMLDLMSHAAISEADIQRFNGILNEHLIQNSCNQALGSISF